MATSDLLLNQHKTPIAILFDKINIKNNTTLNYLDFDLSAPEPVQIFGSSDNTKTTVVPKLGSAFYKTQDIFYKRLDLSDILSNPIGEIIPNNASTLHQLLPQINTIFGVNILKEDVYNTPAPTYDLSSIPGTVRITVKATPDSFLFIGSYDLLLGPIAQNPTVVPYNIAYYIHTNGYATADYMKVLTSINSDGTANTDFSFLRNVSSVSNFSLNKAIQLNNGSLVLNGDFTLTAKLGAAITASSITCKSLTVLPNGALLSTSPTPLFHPTTEKKYFSNALVPFKYVIDTDVLTGNANGVYRFGQDGLLDASFNCSVIQYIPTLLSVCDDASVYVVSPVYTAPLITNSNLPTKQIRIDRINADGSLDTTFAAVIISGNGNDTPLPVVNIVSIAGNGFWMLLQPLYGVSTSSISPVINGTPSVPGNIVDAYSWNPIFRISQSGAVNKTFSNALKNHLDQSVFNYPGSNLKVGDNTFIADATSVTFFTQKNNPITGYNFRQPLVLDTQAKVKYLSGFDYEQQWRWVSATEILVESDGKFVSFGKLSVAQIDGSYGPVTYCIAKYKKTGAIDNLIYRQPTTTTLGVPLVLVNVLSYKK